MPSKDFEALVLLAKEKSKKWIKGTDDRAPKQLHCEDGRCILGVLIKDATTYKRYDDYENVYVDVELDENDKHFPDPDIAASILGITPSLASYVAAVNDGVQAALGNDDRKWVLEVLGVDPDAS